MLPAFTALPSFRSNPWARWPAPLLLAATLGLGGCASLAPPAAPDATATSAARAQHSAIDLGGRLSVRYQQQGSEQALHGSFDWHQTSQGTRVTLLSPLGQIMAIIEVGPGGATLTKAGQVVHSASDVDALTQEVLGWPLPVAHLQDWLQGFARDAQGQPWVAQPGQAQQVQTDDGWRLHYVSWEGTGDAARPRRLDLERMTQQAGQVAIRIIIDSWQPQ